MSRGKETEPNKVLGCSLLHAHAEEPLALVSRILLRSGVKIGKVDRKLNLIIGRIGSLFDAHACKVRVQIYKQKYMSLIELVCEGSLGRPGKRVLAEYVDLLCDNFDDVKLEEIEGNIQWEPTQEGGKSRRRSHTEAVNLLNSMEVELG